MTRPDEIFLGHFRERLGHRDEGTDAPTLVEHIVALTAAERDTIRTLRNDVEWAWIHAHLVARRFGDETLSWAMTGAGEGLPARLHDAWSAAREIAIAEAEGRALTAAVLAAGPTPAPAPIAVTIG